MTKQWQDPKIYRYRAANPSEPSCRLRAGGKGLRCFNAGVNELGPILVSAESAAGEIWGGGAGGVWSTLSYRHRQEWWSAIGPPYPIGLSKPRIRGLRHLGNGTRLGTVNQGLTVAKKWNGPRSWWRSMQLRGGVFVQIGISVRQGELGLTRLRFPLPTNERLDKWIG